MPDDPAPEEFDWDSFPLVPPSYVCDSLLSDSPVELTSSWLAVNLFRGCSFGCAYCFRHRWSSEKNPVATVPVDTALELLRTHPSFHPDLTPLTVNVSSTDPLHPRVKESTLSFAELLDGQIFANPFGIVTKGFLSQADSHRLSALRFLRPVLLVSYSAMPTGLEPCPTERRAATMRHAKEAGLPVVVSYKPLVPGWNDDIEQIESVLVRSRDFARAIVIGGLRLDPAIAQSIEASGQVVPFRVPTPWGEKLLPRELRSLVIEVHSRICPHIPLYEHTSCAISLIMNMKNYNSLRKRNPISCSASCPSCQVARCES